MVKPRKSISIAQKVLIKEYDDLCEFHHKVAPRNGIPVGGGDWMDSFFKLEGVRGMLTALRNGKSLEEALEEGKTLSEIAVRIWNQKREYQVHRWDKTCHDYLETLVRKIFKIRKGKEEMIRTESKNLIVENVQRGATFLDQYVPNWYKRVDAVKLNMASSCKCILGQLYGTFTEGRMKLEEMTVKKNESTISFIMDTSRYGFMLPTDIYFDRNKSNVAEYWQELERAWKVEIEIRKKGDDTNGRNSKKSKTL